MDLWGSSDTNSSTVCRLLFYILTSANRIPDPWSIRGQSLCKRSPKERWRTKSAVELSSRHRRTVLQRRRQIVHAPPEILMQHRKSEEESICPVLLSSGRMQQSVTGRGRGGLPHSFIRRCLAGRGAWGGEVSVGRRLGGSEVMQGIC